MHRFLTTTALALALAGFTASTAVADTITVCASGCDHTSINAAIDAASDGDVIQLSAETYLEGDVIDTDGKAITLLGATDKGGNPVSILDGAESHRVLQCINQEGADTIFENLVIRNGADNRGGGMFNVSSNPTLTDCTFTENSANGLGGGMMNRNDSSPTLTDCTFTENSANGLGGGMANDNSDPTLTGCMFAGNTAESGGGGMVNYALSSPTLTDCTFTENSANGLGGGMANDNSDPTLTGCTFTGNTAEDQGGGMLNYDSSSPTLNDCTFTNNSAENDGGGMYNEGSIATLIDSTVCENTTDGLATDDNQIEGDVDDSSSGNCIAADCTTCTTITVCASGCDFTSINEAIDAASDGDVIQLSAETYFEGQEIKTDGKALSLRGATDKSGAAASVLDGAGTHRVLRCSSGESDQTIIENLVIQNGFNEIGGGGMYIVGSSPTLRNCIFVNNSTTTGGGGIRTRSYLSLTDCTFIGNHANNGGGIFNDSGDLVLTNCTFENNVAGESGGGMKNFRANPTYAGCIFTGNSASDVGGGMYNDQSSPTLTDCRMCENTTDSLATDDNQIQGSIDDSSSDNCIAGECTDCDDTCIGDLNDNGVVDAADIGLLFAVWGSDDPEADFDGDGTVGALDLGYVLGYWGPCP